ncbi:MAG: RNA 3'-terminal phosphate cyclase [Fibrobacterota bacterium]
MVHVDGSLGEGGGQVLRSALCLSILTQTPLRLKNIRAGRRNPGLRLQHTACVRAAAAVAQAEVRGCQIGSSHLEFFPARARCGEWRISVGSAGSALLVLQTVLPVLLTLAGESTIHVVGGTHNPKAPPFEFFRDSFLGILHRLGARAEVSLERYGFFPRGGGGVTLRVSPSRLSPLELSRRGALIGISADIINLRRPGNDAALQAEAVRQVFADADVKRTDSGAVGPGNAVVLRAEFENCTAVKTGILRRGRRPGITARVTAERLQEWLRGDTPVDAHLTDQLMIPLLAGGGGRFTCPAPTLHSTTNAAVIERFTGRKIRFAPSGKQWECTVGAGRYTSGG